MKRSFSLLLSVLLIATAIIPATSSVFAANAAPTVLPAIREWTGSSGSFVPDSSTVLVYNGSEAETQIKLIQGFFADMLGLDVSISSTAPSSNYISFEIGANQTDDEEGYTLVAAETGIKITATTKTGLLYGGISVVQSVYADGFFPCGTAVDYPAYKVRSGLIDVARLYMPMETLMDVTRYMAWYKLNEVHVHINDNGKNGYSAFRLESDIEGLQATDGYYTKAEYRQYQLDAAEYGVTILTEIDSPHHARCFSTVNIDGWTPKLLTTEDGVDENAAGRALDITDEATIQFILDLFTEYLGGDDPVILNNTVHIGMDEYPKLDKYSEAAESYINRLITHVNSLGYKARFWSSFGSNGFLEGAVLDSGLNYDTIYWDTTHSGYAETVALGCDIVNYLNGYLYLVPGWNDQSWESFEDYFGTEAMEFLYNNWQVNQYSCYAAQPDLLASDDPAMLGAAFSIWNDLGSAWVGLTYRDVVDRVRNIAPFVAEKTWNGDDSGTTVSYSDFYSRFTKLCWRAGDVDLFNRDIPDGGIDINFDSELPSYVTASGTTDNGKFILDGESYIALDARYDYVGFPNTLSFELTLEELPGERAYIFASEKGDYKIFVDTDGTIGFEAMISKADKYVFSFEGYTVPVGEKTKLMLTSDMYNTVLVVNGKYAFENVSDHLSLVTSEFAKYRYSTLTIPLSKIGLGVKGKIDNIVVTDAVSEIPDGDNIALNATYSTFNLVDGVVTDENMISRGYSALLTDGVYDTNAPVSNLENSLTGSYNCNDGKWFGFFDNSGAPDEENCESGVGYVLLDLGARYDISKIKMHVEANNAPTSVTVYVSEEADGEYASAGTLSGTASGAAYWISSPVAVTGRYVKLEVDLDSHWALFNEIEVYGAVAVDNFVTVNHLAVDRTAVDLSGKAPLDSGNGVFNFGNVLTDGIAENEVDVTDCSWFTFQKWYNCTDGVGSVVVDLGAEYDLGKIALHLANSNGTFSLDGASDTISATQPANVEAFISSDGTDYDSVGTFETKSDDNIVYWTEISANASARYVKISITVNTTSGIYALMDEIAVYEAESAVEPEVPDTAKNGIVTESDGTLAYYVDDVKQSNLGLIEYEGNYYYVNSSGIVVTGEYWVSNDNGYGYAGMQYFDESGKLVVRNGVVAESDGTLAYYIDNVKQSDLGLIRLESGYYYVNSSGVVVTGDYWITKNNGYGYYGCYTFDETGRLIIKNGVYELSDGTLAFYYYNVRQYDLGLIYYEGDYYYVNNEGIVMTGEYWVTKDNYYPYYGLQQFTEEGKLIIE